MALLEKKQGRRKLFCEAKQFGNVLSVKEWGEGDDRLVGYLRFGSELDALQQQKYWLISKAEEGFLAADGAAKELLQGVVIEKKDKKIGLPFRQDLHFYNEATGFTICGASILGKEIDDTSAQWKKLVKKGLLLPVALIQDDSFNVRVVAGDELSEDESVEWVGKIESYLNLEKDDLCIGAGAEHLYGDSDDAEEADEYVHRIKLPRGKYKATLYMYIPGINGVSCLDELAGGYDKHEPLLPWFRRSRGDVPIPLWLQNWCIGGSELDPSNPKEFSNKPFMNSDELPEMIDFILHLQPCTEFSDADEIDPDSGWFPETTGARVPSVCPKGIEAHKLVRKESKCNLTSLVFPRNVMELLSSKLPTKLDEILVLELDEILDVIAFAQLTHPNTMMEIQLRADEQNLKSLQWNQDISTRIVPVPFSQSTLGILFGNDCKTTAYIDEVQKMLSAFRGLNDGAELEIAFYNHWKASEGVLAGAHRFCGKLKSSRWHVEHVYPAISSSQLISGLALAKEVRQNALSVKDKQEFEKITELALKAFPYHFDDNKPEYADGMLKLTPFDRGVFQMLGQATFATRFPSEWKTNIAELLDDEGDDFDVNDFMQQ